MKPLAILLVLLVIAALVGVGYLWFTSNLTVSFSSVVATDPVSQADVFNQIRASVENETFVGTLFSGDEIGTADQYQFYTYTIRMTNKTFIEAEVIEIQVTPMEGDVLQIGDTEKHGLAAGKTGELGATILTTKSMHSVREAKITYYLWGIPFSTKITLGK